MPQFGKPNRSNSANPVFVPKRPLGTTTPTVSLDHPPKNNTPPRRSLSKKRLLGFAIIAPSIIALIFAICTIYLLATRKAQTSTAIKTESVSLADLENTTPGFYPDQIKNTQGTYHLVINDYAADGAIALSLTIIGQNDAELFVDWTLASPLYELNLPRNDQETLAFSFEKPIADVAIFSPSGKPRNQTFVFIMADGTIEYMPVRSVLQNRAPSSSGKLGDYQNIIKFYHADVTPEDASTPSKTLLIQNASGEIFDLKNDFSIL